MTLTDKHKNYIELEKKKAEYKTFVEELNKATTELVEEFGVGHTFQDAEGIVYEAVIPEGKFVYYYKYSVNRTKREGEAKGSLSVKRAEELGYTPGVKDNESYTKN